MSIASIADLKQFESVGKTTYDGGYEQHFDDYGNHKLVCGGHETRWAGYAQITYLNGRVGHTAYYGMREGVITPDEFAKLIAVT